MTETKPPAAAPAISIGVGAQYIKDFSFESPNVPQIFAHLNTAPQLGIDVNVMSRNMGEGSHETMLKLKLEAKLAGKTAFIADLAYAGVFTMPADVPDEQLMLFLMVEAPRLLFPFARAIIGNAVRESGFPNIVIQPIDFMSLYLSQRGGVGTMAAVGAA